MRNHMETQISQPLLHGLENISYRNANSQNILIPQAKQLTRKTYSSGQTHWSTS